MGLQGQEPMPAPPPTSLGRLLPGAAATSAYAEVPTPRISRSHLNALLGQVLDNVEATLGEETLSPFKVRHAFLLHLHAVCLMGMSMVALGVCMHSQCYCTWAIVASLQLGSFKPLTGLLYQSMAIEHQAGVVQL